jgi:hypothetical protein
MKQTAIDWLIEQWPILESQLPPRIIEQAKAIEKEEMCKFAHKCHKVNGDFIINELYNQIYEADTSRMAS